jgi:Leucine-rich repeat (LRR) protein
MPIADSTRLPSVPYSLVGLEFRGSRTIKSEDLVKLAGITTLSELDLSYTETNDQGLASLDDLGALTTLKLAGTAISDEGIASVVRSCPMLERLDISNTACTAGVVPILASLHQLKELSLVGLPIGDLHLSELAEHRELRMLDLQETQISGKGLGALTGLGNLVNLVLSDTSVGDEGAALLANCKQLEFLALNRCQITDAGMEHLAGLPRLGWLEIRDNKLLGDEGLAKLHKTASLKRLVVSNGVFSQEARTRLQKRLPGCEIKLGDPGLP